MEGEMEGTIVMPTLDDHQTAVVVNEALLSKVVQTIAQDKILPEEMRKAILRTDGRCVFV
jgi:hypothetical protein